MNNDDRSAVAVATNDKPFSQGWRVLLLLVAAFVLCHDLTVPFYTLFHKSSGSIGARTSAICASDGFCRVESVRPGGPMARIGVRVGDDIRFDQPMDYQRPVAVGEELGFTLRRSAAGAEVSHHVVKGEVRANRSILESLVFALPSTLTALVGALLVIGSRRRVAATLLGGALIFTGLSGTFAPAWATERPVYVLMSIALGLVFAGAGPLLIAFARALRREFGGRDPAVWRTVMWSYAALSVAVQIYQTWTTLTGRVLPGVGGLLAFSVGVTYAGPLLAALILAIGWRESQGPVRTRYGFMLVAMLLINSQSFLGLAINLTSNDFTLRNPLYVASSVLPIAGVLVFAYALLRHRVVDLGFVVNRTLIYGVLSSGILLTFGLAEWAIEKILPFSHETSAIIEATVALGIFLVFHRLRDVVEAVVERLLFVRWHHNEALLRTFVAEASFVRKSAVLTEAFVAELKRFSGGAECRLFVADGAERFALANGGEDAATMDGDDPLVVKMRATREAVETDSLLVLPMIHRAELTGFAILGLKPSGDAYRPDERTVLAWAARQIGLDLHALQIERLQEQAVELRQTIASQAAQIQLARDLGALRPA